MFFTFFPNFTFWGWGKRAKNDLKWQKIVYRIPYLSKHTSYDCVFCGSSFKWWHLQMLFSFFFFKILGVGSKRAKNDPKWQNDSNSISVELFFIWLWLLVHMCKLMISPAIFYFFFHFFKIMIFQVFQSSSINAKRRLHPIFTF